MSSTAYRTWVTVRRSRLDELYGAHAAVGSVRPGQRMATEQLNWSIVLRLAAEFQGYARDLHDEGAGIVRRHVHATSTAVENVLITHLIASRRLDTGNATPSNLQQDYQRFGFKVLDELRLRYARSEQWIRALADLNEARNGIAHSDPQSIARSVGEAGLTLDHVRSWDRTLRSLTRAVDRVMGDMLARLTEQEAPW